ncbi:MAG TPA: hypothetical protein VGJ84_00290 [Polyangiaceae bacterium]|jgi:hypothetical protein
MYQNPSRWAGAALVAFVSACGSAEDRGFLSSGSQGGTAGSTGGTSSMGGSGGAASGGAPGSIGGSSAVGGQLGNAGTAGGGSPAAGGGANGFGGASTGGNTGAGGAPSAQCQNLTQQVQAAYAEARKCAQKDVGMPCEMVSGMCCAVGVGSSTSTATLNYLALLNQWKSAGCTSACSGIVCVVPNSSTCEKAPTGNACTLVSFG